jgi:hypothetical protein
VTDRTPLDDLTSDALDTLYDRAEQAERAEAAIARAQSTLTRWERNTLDRASQAPRILDDFRAALNEQPTDTVVITQARHDALVAGQCIHHQEIHRLHHIQPVAGCPYKGCHPNA